MRFTIGTVALLFALHGSVGAHAQGIQTGTVRGTVRDQQGLPIGGASATASSPALQGERRADSAEDGTFTLDLLPPGDYQIRYEARSLAPFTSSVAVPLGGVVEQHIELQVAAVTGTVDVVAEASPLAAPALGLNVRQREVELLAIPRDLTGIARLSPGVSENAPNDGHLVISGAFAFDNLFMVNGVDVNDNVFGNPQDLYIEDAIQETQTLTSGVSAEYGRFSGGVVNAITKSGSNRFSGSARVNLTNPSWTTETPLEEGTSRESDLRGAWEGTFGGPLVTDRLWFFGAGRYANTAVAGTLPVTNAPNTEEHKNRRGEIKATALVAPSQTVQVGYLTNHTTIQNLASPITADRFSLVSPTEPNWYAFGNYRAALRGSTLVDAQYSERRFNFQHFGGTSTSLVESPFLTATQAPAQYNGPYGDGLEQEDRNNRQLTGALSFSFQRAGRHQMKTAYEWFRSHDSGGGSPSASDHLFVADYAVSADGSPLLDSTGHLIPRFEPFLSGLVRAFPQRGAVLNVDTHSAFVQDHWLITPRFSVDVGARFEHVTSAVDPTQVPGVNSSSIAPRLSGAYDVRGDGRQIFRVAYGWYAGRYIRSQIGVNSPVQNPGALQQVYLGPPGEGRGFAPGFDPTNYIPITGQFPDQNVFLDPDLRSPTVREFSAAYGVSFGRGYAEGAYVGRRTVNLIEDFVDTSNGFTLVDVDGVTIGPFTNILWKDTGLAHREYDALSFESRYRLSNRWTLAGHYTLQMRNDGNYEGEGPARPGLTSPIGNYPEAFSAERSYPDGRLQNFERHRLRLWSVYDADWGRFGTASISGLWRVDSGRVYSLAALNEPLSPVQAEKLAAYPDHPEFQPQTIYFGDRGSQFFAGAGLFDTSINYNLPVFKRARPHVKLDVFNLFDNKKLVGFNTTVFADWEGPADALGIPTTYIKAPTFGQPDNPRDFPTPYAGVTGGRSIRLAVGVRF